MPSTQHIRPFATCSAPAQDTLGAEKLKNLSIYDLRFTIDAGRFLTTDEHGLTRMWDAGFEWRVSIFLDKQLRIIPATEADLLAISKLAGVIWHACYPGIITPEQIDYMLVRMYSPETLSAELREGIRYECLLVREELVGFAAYGPAEQPHTFKLHKLYLHPQEHGQGLGSLLLQHCETEVRKLGAQRLILNVNKRNAKAIAAYQRNGFRIIDSAVADIGGGFVMDDFVMAKDFSEQPT